MTLPSPPPLVGGSRAEGDLLREATATLRVAGLDTPRREARWLLEHANGDAEAFRALIARRTARDGHRIVVGQFAAESCAACPQRHIGDGSGDSGAAREQTHDTGKGNESSE